MSGPTNAQFALGVHMATLLAALADAPRSSELLASSAEASPVHVRRVLGRLRRAGIVTSQPGRHGGWRLAADPATTTLADLWRAVHGNESVLGVPDAPLACQVGDRIRHALLDAERKAAAAVERDLAATTLDDLARGTRAAQFAPPPAAA